MARRRLGHDLSCPAWQPIISALRAGWSPQQYCGRIRMLDAMIGFRGPASSLISHETIYKAIFDLPFSPERRDLTRLLRNSLAGRRHRRGRGSKHRSSSLLNITPISQRPLDVLDRQIPGHWEGDLIKGADGKSFVGTLVERTSRMTLLVKLRNATACEVYRAFVRRLQHIPASLRLSLTYDRGSEMALHSRLSKRLNMPVFFCDPYCPWQRPTNENTNGLVRQYLPKGLDLRLISQSQLDAIEFALNTRPRRVLGYHNAQEAFERAAAACIS
jgi:IS30 family transposase